MIHITGQDILGLDRISRLGLINSITGLKPANLIGTISADGQTNLAIISSVVHLGSDPPLIGFIMRPFVGERHTLENIIATGIYTINHINESIAARAHFTSADFPRSISEFDRCKLIPQYLKDFGAPFVAESKVKIGLSLAETIKIKLNQTIMVIGRVEHIIMDEDYVMADNSIDLNASETICISGLNTYHRVEKIAEYPFANQENTPDF